MNITKILNLKYNVGINARSMILSSLTQTTLSLNQIVFPDCVFLGFSKNGHFVLYYYYDSSENSYFVGWHLLNLNNLQPQKVGVLKLASQDPERLGSCYLTLPPKNVIKLIYRYLDSYSFKLMVWEVYSFMITFSACSHEMNFLEENPCKVRMEISPVQVFVTIGANPATFHKNDRVDVVLFARYPYPVQRPNQFYYSSKRKVFALVWNAGCEIQVHYLGAVDDLLHKPKWWSVQQPEVLLLSN